MKKLAALLLFVPGVALAGWSGVETGAHADGHIAQQLVISLQHFYLQLLGLFS